MSLSPTNRERVRQLLRRDAEEPTHLQLRLPTWDEELESLVHDFKSRHVDASPGNLLLARAPKASTGLGTLENTDPADSADLSPVRGKQLEDLLLQHAKMSDNTYCLDFAHPLSPVQAFAIAMVAHTWD
jgi:hypothetical protein